MDQDRKSPPGLSPAIIVVDPIAPHAPRISIAPANSGYPSPRSVSPIAATVPPGHTSDSTGSVRVHFAARRRRAMGVAVALTGLVALGAVVVRMHAGAHKPTLTRDVSNGTAGVRTTPTGADEFWSSSQPPAFVLDPSLERMGADAKAAIVDGITTWSSTSGLHLPQATFSISSTPGEAVQDGVSRIVYAPITVSGFEDALALTISYANESTGQIGESDVIFNSMYTFEVFPGNEAATATCNGHYDVQDVATHETGHIYGLGEDLTDTTTTMFVHSSPCEIHKRMLSTSDVQSMTTLYAQAAPTASATASSTSQPPAGGCGGATIASRRPDSGGMVWIAGTLAGLMWVRRRRPVV